MLGKIHALGLICIEILLLSAKASAQSFPWATTISRTGWKVTADSYQAGSEPEKVLDSNTSTIWQTQYSPELASLPHYIQVDMQKSYVVNGVSYQPRQKGGSNGNIGQHTITLSDDGEAWAQVAFGTYLNDASTKRTFFSNATARYVRLTAQSEAQGAGGQRSSVAELNVYSPDPSMDAGTFEPPPSADAAERGRWEMTVDLPIVPAAGALVRTGAVVLWSAYRPDLYSGGTGLTETVLWDPATQAVAQQTVTNTKHDMFCPGVALGTDGRLVVLGGNDNKKTSTYDAADGDWITGPQMNVGRGYQSAVTLADGRVFTIGGSWSGGRFQKDGEIYDPADGGTWMNVTGCKTAPMLTSDAQGIYRADNHAWLFAYKQNSVFHAGPSRNMNWYDASGTGSWKAAGRRSDAADAMCGIAAMYDASAGLILTAGGSPSYQNSAATRSAYRIELDDANTKPTVTKLPSMTYARAFGSAVVLPDGTVLVVGGQSYAVPFTDTNPSLPAELFDPTQNAWRTLAPIAVPRTYHSIALLLPDATVLAGGGGLCGKGCPQNHLDAQVFAPPYLFAPDGSRAARPTIASVSPATATVSPGDTLEVAVEKTTTGTGTDGAVFSFSLVRHGSNTHTVNTDQRRVPLPAKEVAGGGGDGGGSETTTTTTTTTYEMTLPSDPGVVVPGYWMLFAIDEAGVPSVATTVRVLLP